MLNPYSNKPALIVLNGSSPLESFPVKTIRAYDFILAVDGALDALLEADITPHAVTGDFDSVQSDTLERYKAAGGKVIFDQNQDTTDYEKALHYCLNHRIRHVHVIGYHGSRVDQMWAVFNVALRYEDRISQLFFDPVAETRILLGKDRGGKRLEIRNHENHVCSVIPLIPCQRVTLEGFRWPLSDAEMSLDGMISTSNEIVHENAAIRLDRGALLVILHRNPGKAP